MIAVSDGDQAIERLDAEPPDIVLADVGMPGKNGYEVAAYVRKVVGLRHIPGRAAHGRVRAGGPGARGRAGCDGVLAKPFEPQLVIGRVKELLARSSRPAGVPAPAVDRAGGADSTVPPPGAVGHAGFPLQLGIAARGAAAGAAHGRVERQSRAEQRAQRLLRSARRRIFDAVVRRPGAAADRGRSRSGSDRPRLVRLEGGGDGRHGAVGFAGPAGGRRRLDLPLSYGSPQPEAPFAPAPSRRHSRRSPRSNQRPRVQPSTRPNR